MPRDFFHLRRDGKDVPDIAGADLRDPDQAWEAARATARDLMETQVDADVNWLTCQFEVNRRGWRFRSLSASKGKPKVTAALMNDPLGPA